MNDWQKPPVPVRQIRVIEDGIDPAAGFMVFTPIGAVVWTLTWAKAAPTLWTDGQGLMFLFPFVLLPCGLCCVASFIGVVWGFASIGRKAWPYALVSLFGIAATIWATLAGP